MIEKEEWTEVEAESPAEENKVEEVSDEGSSASAIIREMKSNKVMKRMF